jgi:hypothetical protein
MVGEFKNQLSAAHDEALMRTVGLFSLIALKQKTGRLVADMATGCGKTLSVVSWLTAVHRTGQDVGVVIAASQVEALAKMIRDLEQQGVPREKIGLIHSKDFSPERAAEFLRTGEYAVLGDRYASEPTTTDNTQRPFLFVSHQRVRAAASDTAKEEAFTSYLGKKRDLLIWDEVLHTTAPTAATMAAIRSGVGALRPYLEEVKVDDPLALAMRYLATCEGWIDTEWQRQCDGGAPSGLILPTLTETELEVFSQVVSRKLGEDAPSWPALKMLLAASGQELRLARMGDTKSAIISYRVIIPASLNNVVILDASHVVSRLVALDPTITRDSWFGEQAEQGRNLKTYEGVTIHLGKGNSGRASMEDVFAKRLHDPDSLPARLVKTIREIPGDEAVIVFTFKQRRRGKTDIPGTIKRELRKAGVDPDAKLANGKARITVLTWGQHTSLNEYAHAQNVVFAGVLHLEDETLLAWAVGQTGQLCAPLDDRFNVTDIKRGEIASALYQALSRGSCRYTVNGAAKPMKVWLLHHDPKIKDELNKVMPGLTWQEWEGGKVQDTSKADNLSMQIAAHLRSYAGDKVSCRSIKSALAVKPAMAATFTRATRSLSVPGWERKGASFVRSGTAAAYGFEAI